MLDPVREKCDLHIRAAGIFVMQLELLEIQRLVTLSHNEGPIVAEEPVFATAQRTRALAQASVEAAVSATHQAPKLTGACLSGMPLPFAVVPETELFT